jgi:hypothetical protein
VLRRALPWFESPLVFLRTTGAMESASASLDADADDDWASRYFHVTRGTEHRLGLPWLDARLAICIDIRASFWWSCRQLDGLAARAFRLAGLHPGASIEPAAIVALAEVTPALARRALETLARASLIQTRGHERYSMNTLLRAYAAEQAARHQEQAPP